LEQRERNNGIESESLGSAKLSRGFFTRSDKLDLFQFRALDSEEVCYLNDLAATHEVVWIGAKVFDPGIELPTAHSLGQIEAECAFAICSVLQAELADYHLCPSFMDSNYDASSLLTITGLAQPNLR
jgi:hypothetical protein